MSLPEAHQTENFGAESLRFVESHLDDFPPAPEWALQSPTLLSDPPTSVLDVGCGPATFLKSLVEAFDPSEAMGLEPSGKAVKLLSETVSEDPRLAFQKGSAHSLPFETDSYDLVVCWSVLHWVGRNEYLQALGELVRVASKYLLVMDFVALRNYRVPYSHTEGFFTYKQDFVPALLASGLMDVMEDVRWWDHENPGSVEEVAVDQLEPFAGNPLNYHARRGTLFAKNYQRLPIFDGGYFGT